MSTKKTKREPKAKRAPSEGRKPTLTPFIDGAFDIHAEYKGKEFSARVNADGTITYDGGTYTSPSSAGKAAIKKSVDGWTFWKFKKDGTDVPLDELRGRKSPLKESAA
jgi:Restriction Enzyme Adenine Methylase Associated